MFETRTVVAALAGMVIVAAGCLADDPNPNDVVVVGNGSAVVVMSEYAYLPETLTVDAGSTIDLVIANEGSVEHEIMIGRSPASDGGYVHDLLARMMIPKDESMVGTAFTQTDATPDAVEPPECPDQPAPDHDDGENADHSHDPPEPPPQCSEEDSTRGDEQPDEGENPPDTEHDDAGHHESGDTDLDQGDHHESGDADGDGDHHGDAGHAGAHITVAAGARQSLRLQIPTDAAGVWEIGCFLPGHYEAGMKATLVVRPVGA